MNTVTPYEAAASPDLPCSRDDLAREVAGLTEGAATCNGEHANCTSANDDAVTSPCSPVLQDLEVLECI